MDKITPLAWIAIIAIVIITIGVNLLMVALLRSRAKMDEIGRQLRARGPSRTARMIQDVREIARDPFQGDRKQIDELSKLVAHLPNPPSEGEDVGPGTRKS